MLRVTVPYLSHQVHRQHYSRLTWVGTSLVNFVNSLANTIAAAVFGVAYNLNTAADPTNVAYIQNGVDSVFRLAATVAVIGLVLVIFVVRPKMTAKKAE